MKFRNFTRQPISINAWSNGPQDSTQMISIPPDPEGPIFVDFTETIDEQLELLEGWDINIIGRSYEPLYNFPEPIDGVFLIVTAPVAAHPQLAGRKDILVPCNVIKDSSNRIVGCEAFKRAAL